MLTSKSERLWLSVMRGLLDVEPLAEPPWPDDRMPVICAEMEEEVVTFYGQVMKYSRLCGLGAIEAVHGLKECAGADAPPEVRWFDYAAYRSPVEITDIQDVMTSLRKEASEVRSQCMLEDEAETQRLLACFDIVSGEPLSRVSGYSSRTPWYIYGLAKNGEIVVRCKINFDAITGFLKDVLRSLAPHISIPRVVADKFSLQTTDGNSRKVLIPETCLVPEGITDSKAAGGVIDAKLGDANEESEKEVTLGRSLGVAIERLRTLSDWINWEIFELGNDRGRIFRLGRSRVRAELGGPGGVEHEEEAEGSRDAAGPDLLKFAKELQESAIKQFVLNDQIFTMAGETRSALREIKSSLDKVGVLCKELHVDSAAAVFENVIEKVFDVLNEQKNNHGGRAVIERLENQISSRERLLEQLPVLEAMIPLVYGELRLRELVEDGEHFDVEGGVREGLSDREQSERALDLAYKLLRQGAAPNVCVPIVARQYESVINRMAGYIFKTYERAYIPGFSQLKIQQKISQLKNNVPRDRSDLQRFLSVADSLRLIRNLTIHPDDEGLFGGVALHDEIGKHEARFFLEGIAVMLQVLGRVQDE